MHQQRDLRLEEGQGDNHAPTAALYTPWQHLPWTRSCTDHSDNNFLIPAYIRTLLLVLFLIP